MPRRPKKIIQKRNPRGLTPDQEENLLGGVAFVELLDDSASVWGEGEDPEAMYWTHRDYLLSRCSPGHRPDAYWRFEQKEKRKLVSGIADYWNIPTGGSLNGVTICEDGRKLTLEDVPVYESDYQLLTRLDLLNPGEEEAYHEAQRLEAERKNKIIRLPIPDETEDYDETTK